MAEYKTKLCLSIFRKEKGKREKFFIHLTIKWYPFSVSLSLPSFGLDGLAEKREEEEEGRMEKAQENDFPREHKKWNEKEKKEKNF